MLEHVGFQVLTDRGSPLHERVSSTSLARLCAPLLPPRRLLPRGDPALLPGGGPWAQPASLGHTQRQSPSFLHPEQTRAPLTLPRAGPSLSPLPCIDLFPLLELQSKSQSPTPPWGQPLQASVYPSSSSSMKPLLSLSRMWNTFCTSPKLFFFRPTIWKNLLWSKESAAVGGGGGGQRVKLRTMEGQEGRVGGWGSHSIVDCLPCTSPGAGGGCASVGVGALPKVTQLEMGLHPHVAGSQARPHPSRCPWLMVRVAFEGRGASWFP